MTVQYDTASDEELMARITARDHAAFAVLVRRHTPRFYAVAYRSLFRKSEAEDIVQEAFVKLWNKPELWRADKQAKFTTWFYRVVVHACIDYTRKLQPLPLPDGFDVADERDDVHTSIESAERSNAVKAALLQLPGNQRMAVNLCMYEAMPQKDAAQAMGISVKALESLLVRAKEQLKRMLQHEGVRHAG